MKKKETILLLAAVAVLSAYLMFGGEDGTHYELPRLPVVEKEHISKIEISNSDGRITLNRTGGNWTIEPENYPADASKVTAMLDAISGLALTALVSESHTYDRFDLTEAKKIRVRAFSNDENAFWFDVGKTAGTRQHTFVMVPEDDRVYHARGAIRAVFDARLDDLRDKTVFKVAVQDIHSVDLHNGGKSLSLIRKPAPAAEHEGTSGGDSAEKEDGYVWTSSVGRDVDGGELHRWLSLLAEVKCRNYITGSTGAGAGDPIYRATLTADREYSLSIYSPRAPDDTAYPATSSENPFPFMLPKWKGDKIMIAFDELLTTGS